jgi:hypothetical protein
MTDLSKEQLVELIRSAEAEGRHDKADALEALLFMKLEEDND